MIPTIHDRPRFGPEVRSFGSRKDILLVGGFFNDLRIPNVDAVLFFVMEILHRIRRELPDVRLNVAGNNPPEMLRQLLGDGVSLYRDLRVADLRALYFRAKIGVVPQRFGSGVKYKVTKAMSLGLPLVVSPVGAEGTGLVDGESAYIETDASSFAARVVELYSNSAVWEKMARRAHAIALERFSKNAVKPARSPTLDACSGWLASARGLAPAFLPKRAQYP